MIKSLVLGVCCMMLLLNLSLSTADFTTSFYTNRKTVMPEYEIFWKVTSSELYLAIAATNHSMWVGFGLGEITSGGMGGADFVIAEWNNSELVITDRYGLGKYEPLKDNSNCSNWVLRNYETLSGVLYIELARDLDTQDPQDRPIVPGEMRVLAALGSTPTISYHLTKRHASTATFIPLNTTETPIDGNITIVEFRMNATVPTQTTVYMCRAFPLPNDKDYHLVEFRPYIQPENLKYVHHYVVHICEYQNTSSNYVNIYNSPNAKVCNSPVGGVGVGCLSIVYAWAVGQGNFSVPIEAGFRVGPDSDSIHYLILETHYNNPGNDSGIVDNSGLDLVLTDELRQFDAGLITFGDPFASAKPIPQGSSAYYYETDCPSLCTSTWDHEITLFGSFLHMHSYGSSMFTTLSRNGTRIGYTNKIEFWDYGLQQQTPLNLVVKPGDQLNTVCIYDTTTAPSDVRFGISSADEMCMDFVSYYPKLKSRSGNSFNFCGAIGFQNQFYPNGTRQIISNTQTTMCGSAFDIAAVLDNSGISIPNPIIPIPTELKNSDITKSFGISGGSACAPNPTVTPIITPTTSTIEPSPVPLSGSVKMFSALLTLFFVLIL